MNVEQTMVCSPVGRLASPDSSFAVCAPKESDNSITVTDACLSGTSFFVNHTDAICPTV